MRGRLKGFLDEPPGTLGASSCGRYGCTSVSAPNEPSAALQQEVTSGFDWPEFTHIGSELGRDVENKTRVMSVRMFRF